LVIEPTEFTGAEAMDELQDISHMTMYAKSDPSPSNVEERAKGPPTRRPEQGQSRLMAAIGNDPALFDRYRFVKETKTGTESSPGKGKSVLRETDIPMGQDAETGTGYRHSTLSKWCSSQGLTGYSSFVEHRPQQKIGVMALLEELGGMCQLIERAVETQ